MKRRIFNSAAIVSALFLLALTAMWVRSFWRHDSLQHFQAYVEADGGEVQASWTLQSRRGRIHLSRRVIRISAAQQWRARLSSLTQLFPREKMPHSDWSWSANEPSQPGVIATWWTTHSGFTFGELPNGDRLVPKTYRYAGMPYWMPILLTAIAPAVWLRHWWRRRRTAPGHCHSCGYDLRATPDRCPECGTAAEAAE